MSDATQINPDGECFRGFPWSDQMRFTDDDGNPTFLDADGNPVDLSTATFEVLSEQVEGISCSWDLAASTVTLSLTEDQTAAMTSTSFRWYLAETTIVDQPLFWRRVTVDRVR